jgi:signal transduction histidine kinase
MARLKGAKMGSDDRSRRLRDEVFAAVAHDLQNQVIAVRMLANLLAAGDGDLRSAKVTDGIRRSADRMSHLLKNLIDAGRMDAGTLSLALTPLAPAELVSEAAAARRQVAAGANVELRLNVAPDLPAIWADRDRLMRALDELLGEAIAFAGPDGRVTLDASAGGAGVAFEITHTGSRCDNLSHLFEVARGLIEAHGGSVRVDGSRVSFAVPAASEAAALQPF